MKKNYLIELWRFVASFIIASYHISFIFHTGWIFVEFFFMISGFFAFKHCMKKNKDTESENFPIIYTLKKLIKILPYSSIAIILMYIRQVSEFNLSLKESIKFGFYTFENLFLVNGTGMIPKTFMINDIYGISYMSVPPLWYLSVLVVALPIMIYLVQGLYRKLGLGLVGLFPCLIYGYIIMKDGTINGWHEKSGFYIILCLRGLAGLLLGGLIYYLSDALLGIQKEKEANNKNVLEWVLFIVEIGTFIGVIFISTLMKSEFEFLAVLLLVISLSITFSGITVTSNISGRLLKYLGKMSLPIYCIHPVVHYCMGGDDKVKFYIITFLAALFILLMVEGVNVCVGKRNTKKI